MRTLKIVDFTFVHSVWKQPPRLTIDDYSDFGITGWYNRSENKKLFPDKIKNLKGKFRVGVSSDWPDVYKKNYGHPTHLIPQMGLLKVYECFEGYLNTTTTYVKLDNNKNLLENLVNQNLQFILSHSAMIMDAISIPYITGFGKFLALVPTVNETKIEVSMDILYTLFLLFILIISILLLFKYSRNSSTSWSFLDIFNLMLGNFADVQVPNIMSKAIYLFLLFISIFCISDLVSNLTKISFQTNERLLASSVNELLQKNISVCFNGSALFLENLRNNAINEVRELFSKTIVGCPKQLGDKEVMINVDLDCEKTLFSYLSRGIKNFEIVDINLPIIIYAIPFTLNSPFKSTFAEVDTRIKESGLDLKWASDEIVTKIEGKSNEFETDSEVMKVVLPYVIGVGCSLAFIVLLFEIVRNRINTYKDIYYIIFDDEFNYYNLRNCLELIKFVLNLHGLRKQVVKMWKCFVNVAKWCWLKIKPN